MNRTPEIQNEIITEQLITTNASQSLMPLKLKSLMPLKCIV
jgi:hypothetical protein